MVQEKEKRQRREEKEKMKSHPFKKSTKVGRSPEKEEEG